MSDTVIGTGKLIVSLTHTQTDRKAYRITHTHTHTHTHTYIYIYIGIEKVIVSPPPTHTGTEKLIMLLRSIGIEGFIVSHTLIHIHREPEKHIVSHTNLYRDRYTYSVTSTDIATEHLKVSHKVIDGKAYCVTHKCI